MTQPLIRFGLAFIGAICTPTFACAGAWTLPQGQTQIIETTTYSTADLNFDAGGDADKPVTFRKLLTSAYAEYGWNDWLTLIVSPEYARATSGAPGRMTQRAGDFAFGAGARARLWDSFGVVSVQLMAKSAGAFDMSTSVNEASGEQVELRGLYGTNFTLFGRAGYFDAQLAERWIAGARPSETAADLTLGYDMGWHQEAMLQSFNIIAGGDARAPYTYYRSHKIALSVVTPIWGGFSVQSGSFLSPAGQNALAEHGLFVALWAKF